MILAIAFALEGGRGGGGAVVMVDRRLDLEVVSEFKLGLGR